MTLESRGIAAALVLLLVCATFGEGGASPGALLATHALLVLLLFAALWSPGGLPRRSLPAGPTVAWLAFLGLSFIGAVASPYFYAAFLMLLELGASFAVACLAARCGPALPRFASWTLLGAAAAHSCYALLAARILGEGRPAGTFLNPTHLAGWLCAVLLLAFGRTIEGTYRRLVCAALALPVLLAVLSIGSRGALLGLAVGLGVLLRSWWPRMSGRSRIAAASLAVLLVGTAVFGVVARFRQPDPYRYQRLSIWAACLRTSFESPWTGTGPGQFAPAAANMNFPLAEGPLRYEKVFTSTHSDLLRLPCELGYPAAVAVLLALGLAAIEIRRRRRDPEFAAGTNGAAAALVCLGTQALFENLSDRPAVYLLASLLLGSLLSQPGVHTRSFGRAWRLSLSVALSTLFLVGDLSPYLAWRCLHGLPRGRLDTAQREQLRKAVERNPLHPDYRLRVAEDIAGDGTGWSIPEYAMAREEAEHAVRLQPRDPSYWCGVARIESLACRTLFRDEGTRKRARLAYEHAEALARYDPLLVLEEGIFLLRTSDPEGARRAAERALRIEPQAVPARLLLAEAFLAAEGARAADDASRLIDEAAEIASRWNHWPKESYYARQLLRLDAAYESALRSHIARLVEDASKDARRGG